jgi:ribosome-associated protein
MEELQEKTLRREPVTVERAAEITPWTQLDEAVKLAVRSASDKKASELRVLDLRDVASFTEYFVVASGANQRQVQAIADAIDEHLKSQLGMRVTRIEGYQSAEWVLMDYGDFVVHIFDKNAREFYDLERLWRDARRVMLPDEL